MLVDGARCFVLTCLHDLIASCGAILGYNGFGINQTVDVTLALAETYRPKIFFAGPPGRLHLRHSGCFHHAALPHFP
jgi:hypothetical protein